MKGSALAAVAELAGYPLSPADLEQVAGILASMQQDIQTLRNLELPDDVEPVLIFRVEPWT
jgi:hypothetical protein